MPRPFISERHLDVLAGHLQNMYGPYSKTRRYHTALTAAAVSFLTGFWWLLPYKTFLHTPAYRYFIGPEEVWALFCVIPALFIYWGVYHEHWAVLKKALLCHMCFWIVIGIIFYNTNREGTGFIICWVIAFLGSDAYVESQLTERLFMDSLVAVREHPIFKQGDTGHGPN